MTDYAEVVRAFALLGAQIFQADPRQRYRYIGQHAKRPLEPGFIPLDKPPRIVTVSLYPNEASLPSPAFADSRSSIEAWGKSGSVDDYERAYRDWIATLPEIPFYRDFNAPIFAELGIAATEFAWLPLIKCPLPPRTAIPEDDLIADRTWLWEQMYPMRPQVILAQGKEPYQVVGDMCRDKFPHHIVLQRIGRVGTGAKHAAEDVRVVRELEHAMRPEFIDPNMISWFPKVPG
jgi:hypothetical protein